MIIAFLSIAFILIITKETLFWAYLLQLKEYRRDKLREYFKSPQGKASIFSKKYVIRIILCIVLVLVGGLIEANANSYNDIFFALASLSIIADGCRSGRSLMRGIKKPDTTKRMILILLMTLLVNIVIIGIIIGAIIMMHHQFDTDEFFTTIYDIFRGYIVPFYALQAVPRFPLLIAHLLVLPISIYQKKKVLGQAKSYITRQGRTTIGISGSYGKSSIKMFLDALLRSQYPVISTPGNVNTEIGISQFVLESSNFGSLELGRQKEDTKTPKYQNTKTLFICEMGTYAIGETKIIGDIVNHSYGFLTGLNNQHVDLFGSLHNAIQAESEILINLRQVNGTIYANRDDALVRSVSFAGVRLVRYSITNPSADAFSDSISGQPGAYSFTLHYKEEKYDFQTNVIGKHNILNLTGVIACALDLGVNMISIQACIKSIGQYQKTLHISHLPSGKERAGGDPHYILIDDTYNINQDGIKAGLDLLSEYKTRKIVVIDEIIELGEESEQTHRQIGQTLSQYDLDLIILTGKNYGDSIAEAYKGNTQLIKSYKIGEISCMDAIKNFHDTTTVVFLGRGAKNLLQLLIK